MVACSMANARNVTIEERLSPETKPLTHLPKALREKLKKPRLRYYVLNIGPITRALETEGNIRQNGLKRALHICRGHFATYHPDRPLFGRPGAHGAFWVPEHERGHQSEGLVTKDYSVAAPT